MTYVPFATDTFTTTGADETNFALSWTAPYVIYATDVSATVTHDTIYPNGVSWTVSSVNNGTAVLATGIPANSTVKITRATSISDNFAHFEAGSALTAANLNTNNDQLLFGLQELTDKVFEIDGTFLTSGDVDLSITTEPTRNRINNTAGDDTFINAATTTDAGLLTASDKTKLDSIETNAKDDQTAAEIRTLVDAANDSNVFTDADHSKLDGIESGATADLTGAEIKLLYETESNTNAFTNAEKTKLLNIENNATGDQTAAEIKQLYESNLDTNAFTDGERGKLATISVGATADQTGDVIKELYEAEPDTNAFTDAEKTKLSGIETAATADQTGAEIKALYEAEADTNAFTDALKQQVEDNKESWESFQFQCDSGFAHTGYGVTDTTIIVGANGITTTGNNNKQITIGIGGTITTPEVESNTTIRIDANGAGSDVRLEAADHILFVSGTEEDGNIYFRGNGGVDSYRFAKSGQTAIEAFLSFESLSTDRTFTFPDNTGTIALTSSTVNQANNADTVDNKHATDLVIKDTTASFQHVTSKFSCEQQLMIDRRNTSDALPRLLLYDQTFPYDWHQIALDGDNLVIEAGVGGSANDLGAGSGNIRLRGFNNSNAGAVTIKSGGSDHQIWHAGNDGASSGLDADLLDGQHGSYYRNASNLNAGTIPDARISDIGDSQARIITLDNLEKSNLNADGQLGFDSSQGLLVYRTQQNVLSPSAVTVLDGANVQAGSNITISNTGSGGTGTETFTFAVNSTNLNADTVDNLHAGSFIRADASDNVSGHTEWQDNYEIRLGSGADFRMEFNGTDTVFRNYAHAGGDIIFQGEDSGGNNENLLILDTSGTAGYVRLFRGNSEKLRTVSAGIDVTGTIVFDGGTCGGELQVNGRLDVGAPGNDHEIRIYKSDNNVSDHIQFYNGTTRMGEIGCEDTTWLRINQETNKNIYTRRYIRADGGLFVDGTTRGINGNGEFLVGPGSRTDLGLKFGNDEDTGMYRAGTNSLALVTGGNVRTVIASNGSQTHAAQGNPTRAHIFKSSRGSASNRYIISGYHSATANDASGGSEVFRVRTNGGVQNTANVYTSLSDERLKENIVDAQSQWDDVKALRLVNFNFTEQVNYGPEKLLGFIAQEVEQICPSLVDDDALDDDESLVPGQKSVKNSIIMTKAFGALQEAMARIEQLEARITQLESPNEEESNGSTV